MESAFKITKKAALANTGKTQREMAETLGISRKTLNNWLNKKITKTRDLMAFCYACNININNVIN